MSTKLTSNVRGSDFQCLVNGTQGFAIGTLGAGEGIILQIVGFSLKSSKIPLEGTRIACVQTPIPSGKIGEGPLLRFFLRGGGGVCTQVSTRILLCVRCEVHFNLSRATTGRSSGGGMFQAFFTGRNLIKLLRQDDVILFFQLARSK